jgi:spore germination protein YaaH
VKPFVAAAGLTAAFACLLAASAGAGATRGTAAPAAACAYRPVGLRFVRTPRTPAGVLAWKRPARMPLRSAGYRVYRNGKVVGQTVARIHRLRVSFVPGKAVTFMVRVALRTGATVPCADRLTQTVAWTPPTAPFDLVAQPQTDAVTLSWQPAKPGDGRLNDYRIFRDGKAFRNVKDTTLTFAVPPLRTFTMSVAAVDTQGQVSQMSNTVTIRADHAPPTQPTGLTAQATSASQIALSWQPAAAAGGANLAYRVLRNGATFGQTTGTSTVIGNLAPATAYTFTVMAVDSLGYASAQSDSASATTEAPPPTTGVAHVFLLASTGTSFKDLQAHYMEVGTVYPTYYECNNTGAFNGADVPLITNWARLRGIKVEARWNCQQTTTLHRLLTNPAARAALEAQMVSAAVASNWDGVNIDFEAGAAADRPYLTIFITELAAALHAQGKTLSMEVSAKVADVPNHPRSTFFDYNALSYQADSIFVMCWGIHWRTSAPGAIDDMTWATQVAAYVAGRPNKQKFVLGFGMYGFDWPNGGGSANAATPLEYADVVALQQQTNAPVQWDPVAAAPHFSYTDSNGAPHDVWFTDAQSIGARIALAHSYGLGIGLWRLGDEDQGIWSDPLLQPGAW